MLAGALPMVATALALLGASGTAAAAGPYSGHAVLRVVPASEEQLLALHEFLQEHDMVGASRLPLAGKIIWTHQHYEHNNPRTHRQ